MNLFVDPEFRVSKCKCEYHKILITYFVATPLVVLLAWGIDEAVFGDRSTGLSSAAGGAAVASVERNIVLGLQMNAWRWNFR